MQYSSKRVKWMIDTVTDSLGRQKQDVTEYFQQDKNFLQIKDFLDGVAPPKIFFFYQKKQEGFVQEAFKTVNNDDEIILNQGEEDRLSKKACYFYRNLPEGKAVNFEMANDEEVLFGEISPDMIMQLNQLMNNVYDKMIQTIRNDEWGKCTGSQVNEFLTQSRKFKLDLNESVKSLRNDLNICVLNKDDFAGLSENDKFRQYQKKFKEWLDAFTEKLKDDMGGKTDFEDSSKSPGPKTELEYWRKRLQNITALSEQLKSEDFNTVKEYLKKQKPQEANNRRMPNEENISNLLAEYQMKEVDLSDKLNQAKDNVKYLGILEKFIEPLYKGTPETIIETLPALMNAIKMIHTIARYYSGTTAMTNLFCKITNQMITNCKQYITVGSIPKQEVEENAEVDEESEDEDINQDNQQIIWDRDPDELISVLQSCIKLNQSYQEQYRFIKEKVQDLPRGNHFDFSETQIFWKFDIFERRVFKLIEIFRTKQQFNALQKHNLEGIDDLIGKFDKKMNEFKNKKHNLLAFEKTKFDKDYVEFNVEISRLDHELQEFIDQNFTKFRNIEYSLKLLTKFENILKRNSLRHNLQNKYNHILHTYAAELESIQKKFNEHTKQDPPIVRNMPPEAGKIIWARHLFKKITGPIHQFPKTTITKNELQTQLASYNTIGLKLKIYEQWFFRTWCEDIERAKAGLQATLIVRESDTGSLYVNFDIAILQLIREAKCLERQHIQIPETARIILLQEVKFKMYFNELQYVLNEHKKILGKIKPITKDLLQPHLEDLELKLRPGMVTLTWTSMNIDSYLSHVHSGLNKLDQLIISVNDIIENRIENNLKKVSKVLLVDLPDDTAAMSLDQFVEKQENHINNLTSFLMAKNEEVERAVDDLISTVMNYELDPHIIEDKDNIHLKEAKKIKKYYFWYLYQALLNATQNSLNAMKYRVCGKRVDGGGGGSGELNPFFVVDVYLDSKKVKLKPDLSNIQKAINKAATAVLRCSRNLFNWDQKDKIDSKKETFYDMIAKDREIVKVILLLTGSIQGAKNIVNVFLESFKKFSWLWIKQIKTELDEFQNADPSNQDYEDTLKNFNTVESEIKMIKQEFKIGAMSLKMVRIQQDLAAWAKQWKLSYSDSLHYKAYKSLEAYTEQTKQLRQKISYIVKDDIDSLGKVMSTLEEIRKRQAVIQMKYGPMFEQYQILDLFLPQRITDKEELDRKSTLNRDWFDLISLAENKQKELQSKQADFLKRLKEDVTVFIGDVDNFHTEYSREGPMVPNIEPSEAISRLKEFEDRFDMMKRRYEINNAGEELFGLPHQQYPKLMQIDMELRNLSQLYKLYSNVLETLTEWKEKLWSEIEQDMISEWIDEIERFKKMCVSLPKDLKTWQAYTELKEKIESYKEVLPIISELKKPSICDRHWLKVVDVTGDQIPFDQEEIFVMEDLMKAKILENKEEIEDICDSADKQVAIKKKLDELGAYWDYAEFTFAKWKQREQDCVLGMTTVNDILEKLEEDQLILSTISANRHIGPFKAKVTERQSQFSTVDTILELWIKVQSSWTSLEAVYIGGDIAKAMPVEAKKFAGVDKTWLKIMEKGSETKKVIQCCQNEMLKSFLPELDERLEECQKSLDLYLEKKRSIFSRFYFVSDPVLLVILSQGSNPKAVQEYFGGKLFDAISVVEFIKGKSKSKGSSVQQIVSIMEIIGKKKEIVKLINGVKCEGNIEDWLRKLEKSMQKTLRDLCKKCNESLDGVKKMPDGTGVALRDWVKTQTSQVALLGIQMMWTTGIQNTLMKTTSKQEKPNLDPEKVSADFVLAELSNICLDDTLSKLDRKKVETMVTIQVHQRDLVFDELAKIQSATDFKWEKQTRIHWIDEYEHCFVYVTNWRCKYSYEYLGTKERLAITPLTDRCYITIAQALNMNFGAAPAGPAGTGKTETVKDMGRTLGIFVIVTNCSPEQRYKDMEKIFKGLCQSGLWGCFDEFNRINLDVLSVVAMQVERITIAKKMKQRTFFFPGNAKPIGLNSTVGYFITMNPGYAGRQELPENLKVLFRYVSMMVPDRQIIMKVKLASVGYNEFQNLSVKFATLYQLCEEQLSNQRHYDFGLRNILSVLRTMGMTKRGELQTPEEILCMRTLRDMNLSKLVFDDVKLFKSLISDIFPKQKEPQKQTYPEMEKAVDIKMKAHNYVIQDSFILKIVQLYETQRVRHGFMLIGHSGVGKSVIKEILVEASGDFDLDHMQKKMNPKAITDTQMYGKKSATDEWTPGVFSKLWEQYNDKKRSNKKWWLVCDGPVDTLWIESLNTVLDDNKILTLASGDRFPMSETVKLVFEVENLNNASPATVSRAGIVYVSEHDLGYEALIYTYTQNKTEKDSKILEELLNKFIIKDRLIELITEEAKEPVMEMNNVTYMTNIIRIINGFVFPLSEKNLQLGDDNNPEQRRLQYAKVITYAVVWAVGGNYELKDRKLIHQLLLEKGYPVPKKGRENETVFDFFLQINHSNEVDWIICQPEEWVPPKGKFQFSRIILPTADTMRAQILIDLVNSSPKDIFFTNSTILLGEAGTQKTASVVLYAEGKEQKLFKRMNFSSATDPQSFQESIEQACDVKIGNNVCVPPQNKEMLLFIDDINMPLINAWGDQVTLEIVRQLIEESGFYQLERQYIGKFKTIKKLQYIGAMQHPGGGKNDIPNRAKRHFFIFNMTLPASIKLIFGPIIKFHFKEKYFTPEFNRVVDGLCGATIKLWNKVQQTMLRTPSKFHYVFNMRELSRIFKGILNIKRDVAKKALNLQGMQSYIYLIALWKHECERVFVDKLISLKDKKTVNEYIQEISFESFSQHESEIIEQLKAEKEIFFCDFLRLEEFNEEGEIVGKAPQIYEAIGNIDALRKRVTQLMDRYNKVNPSKRLELVLFEDALRHLLRISRIIKQDRSSALLVGVGGSGKQSLTKLASFIGDYNLDQISLTKGFGTTQLKEFICGMYNLAGHLNQPSTFLLTDQEIRYEYFLEFINMILSTGDIPNLIAKDDREIWLGDIKNQEIKIRGKSFDPSPNECWDIFINRVRDNLHMVLCFSPVGQKFRDRAQQFPSLFNECAINWFLPWPEEALVSVAENFVKDFAELTTEEETKLELQNHMGCVHIMVNQICEQYLKRMRRYVYVTPKSFLSFIGFYKELYIDKFSSLDTDEKSFKIGLDKIQEASVEIRKMGDELKIQQQTLKKAVEKTDKFVEKLKKESTKAEKKKREVAKTEMECQAQADYCVKEKEICNKELQAAIPALSRATKAANAIKKKDVDEVRKIKKEATKPLTKYVMDLVSILFMEPLEHMKVQKINPYKDTSQETTFFISSFDKQNKKKEPIGGYKVLQDQDFMNKISRFGSPEHRDEINDETCELMEPYGIGNEDWFNPARAKATSTAVLGLYNWCWAMKDYHEKAKIVKPRKIAVQIMEGQLAVASQKLRAAQEELVEVKILIQDLSDKYQEQLAEKNALEVNARATKKKMESAQRLISSLKSEKTRWARDAEAIADKKKRLVGDVSLCCAFLSYCGPFNSEFRQILIQKKFIGDMKERGIPVTIGLEISEFLVDDTIIGEWNLQGLPKDDLSIQNGIMTTKSNRYPMLIDPQEQAMEWLKNRYAEKFDPKTCQSTLENKRFKDFILKNCMEEGRCLFIDGIYEEVDPIIDPILEKQIIYKGRNNKFIVIQESMFELHDDFEMFLFTRNPNPHFSPELSAKTLIIDFTVTQSGLEQQLLGRVISKEQKQLEISLKNLLTEVSENKKDLKKLDAQLLNKLTSSTGNLIEDTELVKVLNDTKQRAKEVATILNVAEQKTTEINEKREMYRTVAIRGSVLYFVIIEMILISHMYNTSLQQFLDVFDYSMDVAEKSQSTAERVENIMQMSTYVVYLYVNRGLYENDKLTFLLLIAFKKMITDSKLKGPDVSLYLKGGGDLDQKAEKASPNYLEPSVWMNVIKLSRHKFGRDQHCFFQELPDTMQRHDKDWQEWMNRNDPEMTIIPAEFQEKIDNEKEIGSFMKLCLIRSLRQDRTKIASREFIRAQLGQKFVDPVSDTIQSIYDQSKATEPILYLVTVGGDPTQMIDDLGKKIKVKKVDKVSMGEGQERFARAGVLEAFKEGTWIVLQNCHLGLGYMNELVEFMASDAMLTINEQGRVWITVEQCDEFPLGLLQNSIKVTNEPPKGIKAGMHKTFTTVINQDYLEKVEHQSWKTLIYVMSFLHSIILERRKFGPLGWCIPYGFNYSDLEASLLFMEGYLNNILSTLTLSQTAGTLNINFDWIQYMVCEVQYGGRITDDLDRELFNVYGLEYLKEGIFLQENFTIAEVKLKRARGQGRQQESIKYQVPGPIKEADLLIFQTHIRNMEDNDNPEVFGLNQDADLAYQLKESNEMISTIMDTRPKEAGSDEGKSTDDIVKDSVNDFLSKMPVDYDIRQVREQLQKLGGPPKLVVNGKPAKGLNVPLNVFLLQEIARMDQILRLVRSTLSDIVQAIDGQIIMTPALVSAIGNIFDAKVPYNWLYDTTGAEISWLYPLLGTWFTSLGRRNAQLSRWLQNAQRPNTFWMTGFFNPQGFLTAMKQEVTRMNKGGGRGGYGGGGQQEAWSLDDVILCSEVVERSFDKIQNPKVIGVYIEGLYLEGAQWSKNSLDEPPEKQMYSPLPLLYMSAEKMKKGAGDMEKPQKYYCPIYKYKVRTDLYKICRVQLSCESTGGGNAHWKKRGVALLCSKD